MNTEKQSVSSFDPSNFKLYYDNSSCAICQFGLAPTESESTSEEAIKLTNITVLSCGHLFHKSCYMEYSKLRCAVCFNENSKELNFLHLLEVAKVCKYKETLLHLKKLNENFYKSPVMKAYIEKNSIFE